VEAGETLPHCALPHRTDQVTPAFAESLLTVTASDAVAAMTRVAGGSGVKATEIVPVGGGGGGGGLYGPFHPPPQPAKPKVSSAATTR
jgi:hypothetical protein